MDKTYGRNIMKPGCCLHSPSQLRLCTLSLGSLTALKSLATFPTLCSATLFRTALGMNRITHQTEFPLTNLDCISELLVLTVLKVDNYFDGKYLFQFLPEKTNILFILITDLGRTNDSATKMWK